MRPIIRFLILISAVTATAGSTNLIRSLFSYSNGLEVRPHVRPIQKATDKVPVQVGLALLNIGKVNFDEDTLTTNIWIVTEWNDPSLGWIQVNYGGTKQISVPVSMIWSPDITIFNELTPTPGSSGLGGLATIDSNGQVLWIAPKSLETHCNLGPKAAVHECSVRIGSWTHTSSLVDFNPGGIRKNITVVDRATNKTATAEAYISNGGFDTTPYLSGKRWTIESSSVEKHEVAYQWMPESGGGGTVTELEFKIRFSETRIDSAGACGRGEA